MHAISDEVLASVRAAGFEAYMRDRAATYLYFTDGARIGYLEASRHSGLRLCTVHHPNTRTGTGYAMAEGLTVADLTRDKLEVAFALAPEWAVGDALETVRKWRDFEAFLAANAFNGSHRRATPGA